MALINTYQNRNIICSLKHLLNHPICYWIRSQSLSLHMRWEDSCCLPLRPPSVNSPSPQEVSGQVRLKFLEGYRLRRFFFKIVVQLQLSAFSPHPSTPPQLNPPPSCTSTLPLGFVYVSFIVVPENPSPHYPLPTPLWLLLDCSSVSVVIFCLLFFFVRLRRFIQSGLWCFSHTVPWIK